MDQFGSSLQLEFALPHSILFYLVMAAACFLVGISKGGFGGTMVFLITPIVALILPLPTAVGLLLPILILADSFTLAIYWGRWDKHRLKVLLAGALIGITMATFLLTNLSSDLLKKGLGLMIMGFFIYRLIEKRVLSRLIYQPQRWHAVLAGALSGFASTLAHSGGPPITIYLILQKIQPEIFIASSALFFALVNLIKLPYFLAAGLVDFNLLREILPLVIFTPLGVWVGRRFVTRINKQIFDRVILFFLLVSGSMLLLQ